MIKKMLFCLVLCLLSGNAAVAASVTIAGTVVSYAEPEGFQQADSVFPLCLENIDQVFGLSTEVVGAYLPQAYTRPSGTSVYELPSWYIHLVYDRKYSFLSLGKSAYAGTVWLIEQRIRKEYASQEFKDMLGEVITKAIGRDMSISSMHSLGVLKQTPNCYSLPAYGLGKIAGPDGVTDFPLATMTTFYLVQGKMLVIVQVGQLGSEQDMPKFTRKALKIATQITG